MGLPPSLHVLHQSPSPPGTRRLGSEALERFYGGELLLPEASPAPVTANFVTTIDGVATFERSAARGAAAVSRGSATDRLLMAMLRAAADVILIGAGTLRVTGGHRWTAGTLVPELAAELDAARARATGSARPPALVIASAGGDIPTGHAAFGPDVEAMVVTSAAGAERLGRPPANLRVVVAAEAGPVPPEELLAVIERELAPRLILTEGGPLLLGSLLSAGLVDQLFQTVTPVIAGRTAEASRPGLVDGWAAAADAAPRASLLSLRRDPDDALFLRYRLRRSGAG